MNAMSATDELTAELFTFFNDFSSWENSVIRSSDLSVSEATRSRSWANMAR